MGKFRLEIEDRARQYFIKIYKSGDTTSIKKIEKMIIELSDHLKVGIGNPEPLKHNLSGFFGADV